MPALACQISQSLWDALQRRVSAGEPLSHLVSRALADALQVDHGTLFQVSTTGALVEGIYDGVVSVATLKEHGDFGLGTFADLNGEMVALDGHVFQARPDGAVIEAPGDALVPFAVVTHFQAERTAVIEPCPSFVALETKLDAMRDSANIFFAFRVDGIFDFVKIRIACKAAPDTKLVDATAHQAEFEYTNVEGSLVGFWTPHYARTVNVPGYHLHFLSKDRRIAGHLLDCRAKSLRAQLQHEADFRIAIPETAHFLKADLTRDGSADLDKAERSRGT
jgi:acetolactate decarboxylase